MNGSGERLAFVIAFGAMTGLLLAFVTCCVADIPNVSKGSDIDRRYPDPGCR